MTHRISYIFIALFQLFISFVEGNEDNKIVYLISMPRSCSTVTMRMMEATQKFYIMHEPAIYPYCEQHVEDKELTNGWFTENIIKSFDDIKSHIYEQSRYSNVFVKEICFFMEEYLPYDEELLSNPNVYFIFLIRDPHNSIISYYNKYNKIVPNFSYFIGCKSCLNIFLKIQGKVKNPLTIISAEDLCSHTKTTVEFLFKRLGIPFEEKYLKWEDLGNSFDGVKEWNEVKNTSMLYHWHENAIRSTSFQPIKKNKVDENGVPTFEEIENGTHREACIQMYKENLPSYHKLKEAQSILRQD